MVEANPVKPQLPARSDADGEEKFYVYGTNAEMQADVFQRLEGIEINPLERQLLETLIENPEKNHALIKDTL